MCMNDTPELKIMTRELCHELFRDWENDAGGWETSGSAKSVIADSVTLVSAQAITCSSIRI